MELESQAQLQLRYKVSNNGVFNLDLEVKDVHARIGLYPATSILCNGFLVDLHNVNVDLESGFMRICIMIL
jgi:hypothetical protein